MKDHNIWEALRAIIGGTPTEVITKLMLAVATFIVTIIRDVSFYAMAFALVLIVDAVMGTMLAARKGESIDPWKWLKGPALKGFVLIMFLMVVAVFDMLIRKTPVQHMGESPVVLSASIIGVGAMGWKAAEKAQELTGLKVTEWIGNMFNRFRKP